MFNIVTLFVKIAFLYSLVAVRIWMYFLGKAQKPLIEFRLSVADLDIRKTYNTYNIEPI